MNGLDQAIHRKVKQWLAFADEDLVFAQHGLTLETGCPCRLIAYQAHQCVEKHLKAYLVYRRTDFPYTHNISRILSLCATHASWPGGIECVKELTTYGVTTRYPGEDEEVTREEAISAVEIARQVREAVRAALLEEGYYERR